MYTFYFKLIDYSPDAENDPNVINFTIQYTYFDSDGNVQGTNEYFPTVSVSGFPDLTSIQATIAEMAVSDLNGGDALNAIWL